MRNSLGKLRRIIASIMAVLMMIGLVPATTFAATGYNINYVDRLTNPDGFYNNLTKGGKEYAYILDTTKAPSLSITHSDFKQGKDSNGNTYIYTSASKVPTKAGRSNAAVWNNVLTWTWKNAGYIGHDKSKTFDLVLSLDKVVCMMGKSQQLDVKNYPYYSVAVFEKNEGPMAHSYCHNAQYEIQPAPKYGPFTVENWSIKLLNSSGNVIKNTILVQTYKDIDVYHSSTDTDYTPTFAEGFYLMSGFATDTYLRKDYELQVYNAEGVSNSAYRATQEISSSQYDYQPHWLVAAIVDGSAKLQWQGQQCGSIIVNAPNTQYPTPDGPKKTVNKNIVEVLEDVSWTVTQDFPDTNPLNAPTQIDVVDEFDNLLEIKGDEIKVYDGDNKDVTSEWTKTISGQKVTLTAKTPDTVHGSYRFVYPTRVKNENLDEKTIVVIGGKTYAEIPNYATVTVTHKNGTWTKKTDIPTIHVGDAEIELTKNVDKEHINNAVVGDALKYTFLIKNTGKFTLHDVQLTDSLQVKNLKIDWSSSSDSSTGDRILSPGETVTGSADYALVAADIDAGKVHNTAEVTGKDPKGNTVKDDDDADTTLSAVPPVPDPKKDVDKTIVQANETVTWTVTENFPALGSIAKEIVVSDTFDDILSVKDSSVKVLDPNGATVTSDWTVAVDGQKVTLTANNPASVKGKYSFVYTTVVKDGNLDGKTLVVKEGETYAEIPNTAVVKVNDDPHTSNKVTVLVPASSIKLTKDVDKKHISDAHEGDPLKYTFEIENTGEVTLHAVELTDSLQVTNLKIDWASSSDSATGNGVLSPGEKVKGSADYALTEADIAAGKVHNTAEVTGKDPKDNTVKDDDDADTTISELPPVPDPKKDVDKTTVQADDTINWTVSEDFPALGADAKKIVVEDTFDDILRISKGDVKVLKEGNDVTTAWTVAVDGQKVTLTANDPTSVSGKYSFVYTTVVKDGNLDGKTLVIQKGETYAKIPNTAVIEVNDTPYNTNEVEVRIPASSIKLTKDVDKTHIADAHAGDALKYSFEIKNTGKVTLHNVQLTDSLPVKNLKIDWASSSDGSTGEGVLAPNETVKGSADYAVTAADIKASKVHNTAEVTAVDPKGNTVKDDDDADTTLGTVPTPKKSVDKEIVKANETVTWTVTENFPALGADAKKVALEDTFDDNLNIQKNAIKVLDKDNNDVTSKWTIAVDGQKVTVTANAPTTVSGIHTFVFPTIVKDGVLDGKTLVVKEGETYAEIPNTAVLTVNDKPYPSNKVEVLTETSSISLTKDVDKENISDAHVGDKLRYTFLIKNTGKVTLHAVELTDSLPVKNLTIDWASSSDSATGEGVLSPNETVTGSADYSVTADDILAGKVHNTAEVTAIDPKDNTVKDDDDADTTLTAKAGISLSKTADPNSMTNPSAGDEITYDFVITNTGAVPLKSIKFSDDHELVSLTWDTDISGQLEPGQKITGTATYKLTQSDIDAGSVLNKATVKATGTNGEQVSDKDEDTTVINTTPVIQLTKATPKAILTDAKEGYIVNWTFVMKNAGYNTLSNAYIEDHLDGISDIAYDWAGSSDESTGDGVLSPGETVQASATYALKNADMLSGEVVNTATAHGTDPYGTEVTADASASVKITEDPSITLTKTAKETKIEEAKAGDIIHYDFSFTNTGNCPLDEVAIVDELEGISELVYTWPGKPNHLEVGETATATATYALKQEDIDAKEVVNDATANGVSPRGTWVSAPANADTVIITAPKIVLDKDVDLEEIKNAQAGMVINYTVTVSNAGGNTLHDVVLTDTLTDVLYDITIEPEMTTMAPGDSFVMHAKYKITQDDINEGRVPNTASVTAKDPDDTVVNDEDTVETILEQTASDAVTKKASTSKISAVDAKPGYKVDYTFTAKNTGNTTLHDVKFTDEMLAKAGVSIDWKWNEEGILQPGEEIAGKATYAITQEDIDAGSILNVIVMNAKDPSDKPLEPTEAKVETTVEQAAAMTVKKDVDKASLDPAKAGDQLNYTFEAKNTGNVTIQNVRFTDEKLTAAGIEIKWDWSTATKGEGTLLPGESIKGTAEAYGVTQADIDTGKVINKVVMEADDPNGEPVPPADDEVQTVLKQAPDHVVTKSVDPEKIEKAQVGDELNYTFTYENTGNMTLVDIKFTDELLDNYGIEIEWDWSGTESKGETATLLPGEMITGKATYKVTQEDIDAGKVKNTILATAKTPGGPDPDPTESTVETELENVPNLVIKKTVDKAKIENAKVGDILTYSFEIENTGNVTLHNVAIVDKLAGVKPVIDWKTSTDEATGEGLLSPGEKVKATATYAITQKDIDAGKVHNTALATGETPDGKKPESPESEVDTELKGTPALKIVKTVDKTSLSNPAVGTLLTYTFKITNTGSVTLRDISIADSLAGKGLSNITYKYPREDKTLAPGEVLEATATYAITAADITAKKVDNVAIANGKTPDGKEVKSEESKVTTVITVSTTPTTPSTPTTTRTTTTTTATPTKTGDIPWEALGLALLLVAGLGVYAFLKRRKA